MKPNRLNIDPSPRLPFALTSVGRRGLFHVAVSGKGASTSACSLRAHQNHGEEALQLFGERLGVNGGNSSFALTRVQ